MLFYHWLKFHVFLFKCINNGIFNTHNIFVNYICNIIFLSFFFFFFLDITLCLIQSTINTIEFWVNVFYLKHDKDELKSFLKYARSCFMPLSLELCGSLDAIFKYFEWLTKNKLIKKNSNIQLKNITITYISSNRLVS